jgi:hypothetical protein
MIENIKTNALNGKSISYSDIKKRYSSTLNRIPNPTTYIKNIIRRDGRFKIVVVKIGDWSIVKK